jgi:hypothetical protein
MPTPREHKTVQARILTYAQDIGWTFVPRGEAEQRDCRKSPQMTYFVPNMPKYFRIFTDWVEPMKKSRKKGRIGAKKPGHDLGIVL